MDNVRSLVNDTLEDFRATQYVYHIDSGIFFEIREQINGSFILRPLKGQDMSEAPRFLRPIIPEEIKYLGMVPVDIVEGDVLNAEMDYNDALMRQQKNRENFLNILNEFDICPRNISFN